MAYTGKHKQGDESMDEVIKEPMKVRGNLSSNFPGIGKSDSAAG